MTTAADPDPLDPHIFAELVFGRSGVAGRVAGAEPSREQERASRLADEAGMLATELCNARRENTQLLAENARLRRRLEQLERVRAR